MNDASIRTAVQQLLTWEDAHVGFERAVADVPEGLRGVQPPGLPYSLWQLVEHIRRAQHDILEYCRNPDYEELLWPDAYWPVGPAPATAAEWDDAVRAVRDENRTLQSLADTASDLTAAIPHGAGHTYLRELVLVADHTAYHVGQLVLVRRLLGCWP